uniref:Uncharacterized protein n=1 Tax=Branchiostoma floridae TaxID=7739 RepID=C3XTE0_BRAFL|eukprot:XP_002612720.1 hypothetical protein BRAFLDRAFT_99517 [Branchiostoma floridae]
MATRTTSQTIMCFEMTGRGLENTPGCWSRGSKSWKSSSFVGLRRGGQVSMGLDWRPRPQINVNHTAKPLPDGDDDWPGLEINHNQQSQNNGVKLTMTVLMNRIPNIREARLIHRLTIVESKQLQDL